MNKKRYNSIILLLLVVIPVFLSAGEIPDLFITTEKKMQKNYNKLNKDKQIEFDDKFEEVKKSLKRIYKNMWDEFNQRGKDVLPWCIFQVFEDLKNRPRIPLTFSIRNKKTIPSGDNALSKTKVGEFSEHKGIVIYGVYRDYFTYGWSQESTCLKATLFHEILHFATFYGNKSYFNIRKVRNQRGTNVKNFWADEGIIEDCELKLFPCGLEYYYKLRGNWYPNNARQYSETVDDCQTCKLCKEKK